MLSEPYWGKRSGEYSKAEMERNRYFHFFLPPIPRAARGARTRRLTCLTPGARAFQSPPAMKLTGGAKHFFLAGLLALGAYILLYSLVEHTRTRNGPWLLTFRTSTNQAPVVLINQPALGITNVEITFPGAASPLTNGPTTLTVAQPRAVPYDVPFGTCVFMDTTFLPGTLSLRFYQHEVELLPRKLVIDRQPRPWQSHTALALPAAPGPSTNRAP